MAAHGADVAVIGGGPAGYAAALAAAHQGASVVLAEPELLGGTCVHWSCIPTNVLLSSMHVSLEARELAFVGVLTAGDEVDLRALSARRQSMVRTIAGGVAAALRHAGVEVLAGRATLVSPSTLTVGLRDGDTVDVEAQSVIVAAGARWVAPALPGIGADRILTADLVQALDAPPATALVLGDGPADTGFALEYAFLLASLGSAVTLAVPGPLLIPALDAELDEAVAAVFATFGVDVLRDAEVLGGQEAKATVAHAGGEAVIGADVVVVADRRVPLVDGIGLAAAGVGVTGGAIQVDGSCRTNTLGVFAAGDVTGGPMLSAAALHAGEVAGITAAGGSARTRLEALPHVLHTLPPIGWIGQGEDAARRAGADVAVAVVDLATNARAAAGGRDGYLKVVADAGTGEILGVHVVGPAADEILAVAATAMQAELTVADVAAIVPWHPSLTESLIGAARQLA